MDEADGRVVSNFIVQTLRGEPLTLYGSGEQTRSFCYVDDLVEGLIRLMNAEDAYEPVNLGNPNEFTIRALADRLASYVGFPAAYDIVLCPKTIRLTDVVVERREEVSGNRANACPRPWSSQNRGHCKNLARLGS